MAYSERPFLAEVERQLWRQLENTRVAGVDPFRSFGDQICRTAPMPFRCSRKMSRPQNSVHRADQAQRMKNDENRDRQLRFSGQSHGQNVEINIILQINTWPVRPPFIIV